MNNAFLHDILALLLAEMPLSSLVLKDSYQRLKELQIDQYATPVSLLLRARKGKKESIEDLI